MERENILGPKTSMMKVLLYYMVILHEAFVVKEVATYEGEYKSGIKCGLGKMKFPSKDAYHGEWENDKMHGEGTYVYANGDIFSGKYENGIKQGEGTYEYLADQSQLIGTWKDGTIVKGIWKFKDGSEYRGEFSLGKPIGDGLYHLVNGLEQQGNYQCIADEASGESKQLWQGQRPIATVS